MKLDQTNQYVKSLSLKEDKIEDPNAFPFQLPAVAGLDTLHLHPNVTYLIGENGMGKSTLLEGLAIALGFNPEGGTFNFNFSTHDSHSGLADSLRVARGVSRPKDGFFLRAETFYNMATNIEEMDEDPLGGPKVIDSFGGLSLHKQSHGESFFSAFTNRFWGKGLYLLDEPEAALSPSRQLSLLAKINELVEEESQFIIATHSPMLMAYPDAKIIELTEEGLLEQELENTDHYSVMKQFFLDRQRLIHHLFQDFE